jgi:hypothetical protein
MRQGTKRIVMFAVTAALVLLWAGRQAQAACAGGPEVFSCFSEADYLVKAAELGYATFQEGFEDDAVWGSVRTPNRAPSITSQGIVWTANHAQNDISTSGGAARTGQWGLYDPDHGSATGTPMQCDVDVPPEHCLYYDGFTGTRVAEAGSLYAAGGYIRTSTVGADLVMVLDDVTEIGLGQLWDTAHHFFGVIDTRGFTRFAFREIEGKIGQQLLIFGMISRWAICPRGGILSAPGAAASSCSTPTATTSGTAPAAVTSRLASATRRTPRSSATGTATASMTSASGATTSSRSTPTVTISGTVSAGVILRFPSARTPIPL